jgi:glucose-1-phosphate thymidylyltransferase
MIYYPLSVLMLCGIREILIISTPKDLPVFRELFGDGSALGLGIQYAEQARPEGIAQAFLVDSFLGENGAVLILGDNIFDGKLDFMRTALAREEGATILHARSSTQAGTGLSSLTNRATPSRSRKSPPSPRAITRYPVSTFTQPDSRDRPHDQALDARRTGDHDVNREYLRRGSLFVEPLGRGVAWLDTGTPESLLEASIYIAALEHRQGVKIACLEEIAFYTDFIGYENLQALA